MEINLIKFINYANESKLSSLSYKKMVNDFTTKVLKIETHPFDILIIRLKKPKNFEFKSGQYLSVDIPAKEGIIRRPYSIASPTSLNYLELCIRKIKDGKGSEYLSRLNVGDDLKFFGPFGRFIHNGNFENDLIFVALGISITPVKSIIEDLLKKGFNKKIILIVGSRNDKDIPYLEELNKLRERYLNFETHYIFSRPKKENFDGKGYVQKIFLKFLPENFFGDIYICGFFEMIKEITQILMDKDISNERIFSEGHHKYTREN